jgi:two-component system NtrC family response regulator
MAEGRQVVPADLELADVNRSAKVLTLKDAREGAEREAVERAMQRHGGKISRAADELGISRPTLYELMEKLGLRKSDDGETSQ